jgi:hypothetical protein
MEAHTEVFISATKVIGALTETMTKAQIHEAAGKVRALEADGSSQREFFDGMADRFEIYADAREAEGRGA